ncbi:hypothetical protein BSNK01_12510 [Bacillaceae bacterium]
MRNQKLIILEEIQEAIKSLSQEVQWRAELIRRAEEVKSEYPKLVEQLRAYERQHDELIREILMGEKDTPCVVDIRERMNR